MSCSADWLRGIWVGTCPWRHFGAGTGLGLDTGACVQIPVQQETCLVQAHAHQDRDCPLRGTDISGLLIMQGQAPSWSSPTPEFTGRFKTHLSPFGRLDPHWSQALDAI